MTTRMMAAPAGAAVLPAGCGSWAEMADLRERKVKAGALAERASALSP